MKPRPSNVVPETKVPSKETVAALDGLRKEISAGMVLNVTNEYDRVWNNSREAVLRLIESYKRGTGLFQQ